LFALSPHKGDYPRSNIQDIAQKFKFVKLKYRSPPRIKDTGFPSGKILL